MIFHPSRMLVTGGAGFIGSHFILDMLNHYPDLHIINIDKLTYAACLKNLEDASKNVRYHFYQLDICAQTEIETILDEHQIDTIVHFAAESHVDRSIHEPDAFIKTNIQGTYHLLEAAKNVWLQNKIEKHRFHHISTDEVFGSLNSKDPAFTETTSYQPQSPYSASKAASDHLVRAYHNTYQLKVTLSNCSNNYGPHQHAEKLIPTIIRNCLTHQKIPIYSDGLNIRDWLFVKDHCLGIDKIIREGKIGESYNIGGNTEYDNLSLTKLICHMIADQIQVPVEDYIELITFVKDRPGHDFRYAIDASKIKKELGWQPRYSLKEGLENTITWYINRVLHEAIA